MQRQILIALLALQSAVSILNAQPATGAGKVALAGTYTLPRMSLSQFGNPACSDAALEKARRNGLQFSDLPSIGSGLAKVGENEFAGITDRGPNGTVESEDDDDESQRTFPLPQFRPTIVRFKLVEQQIRITEFIPLRNSRGELISGLSNVDGEERLYELPGAKTPLAYDPNGVDPEAIRVLPDGNFLLCEEYSPSILVVSPKGEVLVRYTPASKPLPKAAYPVKPILPAIFAERRANKGFENLALSADGRFAYAILQSPMGDESKKRFAESRVIRALKLDVSRPLEAEVVGEYLLLASPAREYSTKQKQDNISWSDADWIAPDKLLVLERAKGQAKLLLVDLGRAANILGLREESSLAFEDEKNRAKPRVTMAETRAIFSVRDTTGIASDKLEGLAILGPTEIAIANDNDFGIGDNKSAEPSRLWILRLPQALR